MVELYSESLGEPGSPGGTYLGMVRTNAERIVAALAPAGGGRDGHWLLEPFEPEFMQRALLAGMLAVVASSVVGTWVVLRGLSFLGDALAHGVIPGMAARGPLGLQPHRRRAR